MMIHFSKFYTFISQTMVYFHNFTIQVPSKEIIEINECVSWFIILYMFSFLIHTYITVENKMGGDAK